MKASRHHRSTRRIVWGAKGDALTADVVDWQFVGSFPLPYSLRARGEPRRCFRTCVATPPHAAGSGSHAATTCLHSPGGNCQLRQKEPALGVAMELSTTPERRRHAATAASAGEWAAVSAAGAWRVEEVGKQQLMRMTGLPARDLRALDPALPYAAPTVAGRDRAIVVSLESVRAVITASEVLVPIQQQDPAAVPLVRELRALLGSTAATAPTSPPQQLSVHVNQCVLGAPRARSPLASPLNFLLVSWIIIFLTTGYSTVTEWWRRPGWA